MTWIVSLSVAALAVGIWSMTRQPRTKCRRCGLATPWLGVLQRIEWRDGLCDDCRRSETAQRRVTSGVWDMADKGLIRHEDIDAGVLIVWTRVAGLFGEEAT